MNVKEIRKELNKLETTLSISKSKIQQLMAKLDKEYLTEYEKLTELKEE